MDDRPSFEECLGHFTFHPVNPGDTAFCNNCGNWIVLDENFDWQLSSLPVDEDPTRGEFFFSNRGWNRPEMAKWRKTQREIEAER